MMTNEHKNIFYLEDKVEKAHKNVLQSMYEMEEIEKKEELAFKEVREAIKFLLNNLNGLTNGKS